MLQKKNEIKGSATEASPADSGGWRLTKQESAGQFFGSIRIDDIFQLEVWKSSNFVFIFIFTVKSMRKFETYTIDRCYLEQHLGFFSEFPVYTPLQE